MGELKKEPQPEERRVYLGDGAYARMRRGVPEVVVYASDGIRETSKVYLGPHEFETLVLFAKTYLGWEVKT